MDGRLFFTRLPRDVFKIILRFLVGGNELRQCKRAENIVSHMETSCFRLPYPWTQEALLCFKATCRTIDRLVKSDTTRTFVVPRPLGGSHYMGLASLQTRGQAHWILQVKR